MHLYRLGELQYYLTDISLIRVSIYENLLYITILMNIVFNYSIQMAMEFNSIFGQKRHLGLCHPCRPV